MRTLEELQSAVVSCQRCPRLVEHCQSIAAARKREFKDWTYWGKPVPSFGSVSAKLWIVGLAPAAHGANRTGRMFTGDSSGKWLYQALHAVGLANQAVSESKQDGLKLKSVYISAVCHCAPPDNKPMPDEILNCQPYLDEEFLLLKKRKVILALGNIAFNAVLKLLQRQGVAPASPKPQFGHGKLFELGTETILCSYHPSRQNTQTGRLTPSMWSEIFKRAVSLIGLENHPAGKSDLITPLRTDGFEVPLSVHTQ